MGFKTRLRVVVQHLLELVGEGGGDGLQPSEILLLVQNAVKNLENQAASTPGIKSCGGVSAGVCVGRVLYVM